MSSSAAATRLRESFGDRKPPDITRKITACVACRKLKIKCNMNHGSPPCSRCQDRGLSCTVNKSLQMLLEGDVSWKETVERRLEKLEASMDRTMHSTPPTAASPSRDRDTDTDRKTPRHRLSTVPPSVVTLNLSCSLGAFPASSMINFTLRNEQGLFPGQQRPDLISCGVVSHKTAERLFGFYQAHLNPYVYHILSQANTLAATRTRSPLLASAICTVAALLTGSEVYQACLNAFKTEVSRKTFATNHTFDDVRALCIGAFWLSGISSALNGLAVRIATELDLHRCITKMPHTKKACYDRTRLYFLVYLCDRHCSLSHGRPPLTRDFHSLKNPRDFLLSQFSTPSDLSLISQIELWSISGRVFDMFGADIENPVAGQRSVELDSFAVTYDQWVEEWTGLHLYSETEAVFSSSLLSLYYYSAKLYLFSHVFRGPSEETYPLADGVYDFAASAVESALAVVRCIVDGHVNTELWLDKLPLYFGTMTAFASVCLLKALGQEQTITDLDPGEIYGYIHRLTQLLRTSPAADHPEGPWPSIANSLEMATSGWNATSSTVAADDFDPVLCGGDDAGLNLGQYSGEWVQFW